MTIRNITIIGTGNIAWHIGKALKEIGICIDAVAGRDPEKVNKVAAYLGCKGMLISDIKNDGGYYLLAVSDDAIESVAKQIYHQGIILIHTSGSVSSSILHIENNIFGVLYPMQTFTTGIDVQMHDISFYITTSNEALQSNLEVIAHKISNHVYCISDDQRAALHLSAVWANNFTNYMFSIASEFMHENGLDFKMMHQLIDQSIKKLKQYDPMQLQTGPAKRGDKKTLQKHVILMQKHPEWVHLYQEISESIMNKYAKQ